MEASRTDVMLAAMASIAVWWWFMPDLYRSNNYPLFG
jgi:hypothetical protein